jgi:hypothetical protein
MGCSATEKKKNLLYLALISKYVTLNPSNAELNPICHLLTLLEAHHIFHVSGLRVKEQNRPFLCFFA